MSLIKMWGFWKCLELTRGTHHVATPHGGAAHPGPRLGNHIYLLALCYSKYVYHVICVIYASK